MFGSEICKGLFSIKTGKEVKSCSNKMTYMHRSVFVSSQFSKHFDLECYNACRWCNEIHVGTVGHPFKSCRGSGTSIRRGLHEWGDAAVEDVLVPVEAYHLYDRLGKRIRHEERFSIPRIPAVVELCIQAGVDLPEYPTKRRRKPIICIGKKEFVYADESELPDPDPDASKPSILAQIPDTEILPHAAK